jgi:hypothetical protein
MPGGAGKNDDHYRALGGTVPAGATPEEIGRLAAVETVYNFMRASKLPRLTRFVKSKEELLTAVGQIMATQSFSLAKTRHGGGCDEYPQQVLRSSAVDVRGEMSMQSFFSSPNPLLFGVGMSKLVGEKLKEFGCKKSPCRL